MFLGSLCKHQLAGNSKFPSYPLYYLRLSRALFMMPHGSARNAFSPPGSPPSVRDRAVARSEEDEPAPPQEGLAGLDAHRSARGVLELSLDSIRIVPRATPRRRQRDWLHNRCKNEQKRWSPTDRKARQQRTSAAIFHWPRRPSPKCLSTRSVVVWSPRTLPFSNRLAKARQCY